MLLVDSRSGSNYLHQPLKDMGLPAELTTLQFADLAWEGRGNDDVPVQVGIEFKRLGDLAQSLRSGRLQGHQLPGMLGPTGAYHYGWVLIEGHWRVNKLGLIEHEVEKWSKAKRRKTKEWVVLPGNIKGSELEKKMLTLELLGGAHVRFTPDRQSTLHFIANLYRWFTDKSMDRHTTHLDTHHASSFLPISEFRAVVKDHFPGIGLRASIAVERAFKGSLSKATAASADEWARIEIVDRKGKVKKIGTATAEKIIRFCRGDVL